ncbi:Phosphoenolpyruvate carboxykinase [GTP] [Frondihabitans sp. 762G35]|uniref:phosphoenolpyruvate carboxykinase (GTP) n=1 Tax=Frondihabitans sp. 762G35 TaxID=1446794 RepID=UPI000D20EFAC|nr:phosphoenolpyruvate carboxykinase (GTP) [Frondihabitans sp. 762G35]ARC58626.1 Phosphoenolpyruvate carboxykinase [GTP] [Frondihabitans sp. 762G35]
MKTSHIANDLNNWVEEIAALTKPDAVVWYEGDAGQREELTVQMVAEGKLIRLNPAKRPGSFLARSSPEDVARVEDRTFICSTDPADAGPTNNWRAPEDMRRTLDTAFEGSMKGRTMYVVPFALGVIDGPLTQVGVEITDSPYVVLSMGIMARLDVRIRSLIDQGCPWVACVHSVGYPLRDAAGKTRADVAWPSNETKYIAHFPEARQIWSFGSGYGGNALLAKKCFALRIASVMAREEGWLAEHMLLIRITSPEGRRFHVAGAFPSACGKTNLAMLQPTIPGWSIETIGDDIAWLKPGDDGRLWAINPEAGFFGVAPGTSSRTNPVAIETMKSNTIFTNVALDDDGDVWWEGLTDIPPQQLTDWQGHPWDPTSGKPAAHPNSRFTTPIDQCPTLADDIDRGVPIDAIIFGGRRATNVPLVAQARDWSHGVFMGATVSSEQTAAAEGTIGDLRRDPFAMLPFCGYNMADYWRHWLDIGTLLGPKAPAVFQVNWFRKGADDNYLWPGFGENARVLEWIVRRIQGIVSGLSSPLGTLPRTDDLDLNGLDVQAEDLTRLFDIDFGSWHDEARSISSFFDGFGTRLPTQLRDELLLLKRHISGSESIAHDLTSPM